MSTLSVLAAVLAAIQGYLLGSVSFAVIVSRIMAKDDVRKYGSGNAGMTNMLRVYGKKAAAWVLLGDFSKGIAAVALARLLFDWLGAGFMDGGYIGGLFALLGHLFPLYFGFRGGKGVLTSCGIMLLLNPLVFLITVLPMVVLVFAVRIVSLASILGGVIYPIVTYLVLSSQGTPAFFDTFFAAMLGMIVIIMHRQNIKRLLAGTENRFGSKPKQS